MGAVHHTSIEALVPEALQLSGAPNGLFFPGMEEGSELCFRRLEEEVKRDVKLGDVLYRCLCYLIYCNIYIYYMHMSICCYVLIVFLYLYCV